MTGITLILATVISIAFTPVVAQDLQKGLAAAQAGDYAMAFHELTPLAEAGDAKAQYYLGVMYDNGYGVLQDSVTAHMWYNIGAANGNELGGTRRDSIAEGMTSADISKAQSMARECMSSGYRKCGFDMLGSVQLLAKVKVEQAYKSRMLSLWPEVRDALRPERSIIGTIRLQPSADHELKVRISKPDGMAHATEVVRGLATITGFSQTDITVHAITDMDMIITLTDTERLAIADRTVLQVLEVVRRRIDAMGVRELSIQRQGATRILIQLSDVRSRQEVKDIISTKAQLGFHPVVTRVDDPDVFAGVGNMLIPSFNEEGIYYVVKYTPIVTGEELIDSQSQIGQNNRPALMFRFNTLGARAFGVYTAENTGSLLAIVLDREVISTPVIQSHVPGGSVIITGSFSMEEATKLALMLRTGSLPVGLDFLN